MQYKCDVCHDSGSKNQNGDYLDCPECDMPHTRKALNDFVKSLGPTHPEDIALAIHQRALAMAPKQEAPLQWVAIKDSAWVNIVNHDHAYDGWDKDDIINQVFKLTEAKCKELNGPGAAKAAANGALTDEQIFSIHESTNDAESQTLAFARAILAAAGPDAALIKALEEKADRANRELRSANYDLLVANEKLHELTIAGPNAQLVSVLEKILRISQGTGGWFKSSHIAEIVSAALSGAKGN